MKESNLSITPAERMGNFDMGDCFCNVRCVHGHEVRMFNIGRGHFVACDKCRTYIYVGGNLKSDWRQENKDIWEENLNRVLDYKLIE
jgi:hypothetical protein